MATIKKTTAYTLLSIVFLTSVAAIAANLGLFGLDPNSSFAKVSLTAVLVEIVGAFVYLARQSYTSQLTAISAVIRFPDDIDHNRLADMRWDYTKCTYEIMDGKARVKSSGNMAVVLGDGGWECRVPTPDELDDSVELRMVEDNGTVWEVPGFYPLTRTLTARHGPATAPALPFKQVRFNNVAQAAPRESHANWYQWAVYVDEGENVLREIESVEYLLHRTFPNPLRQIDDPTTRFACRSAGWGAFEVFITIHFKNGTELKTSYLLDFAKPWEDAVLKA